MSEDKNTIERPKLHEVVPREVVGRDVIARYQGQFRGAAYECLALLDGGDLDRVYCDYQDDFVTRLNVNGQQIYNFYQVKTKNKLNHQWSVNEIFGLYKKKNQTSIDKIENSFAGKLLIHTVKFNNSCGKVVFLTNIHFDDDVEACMKACIDCDYENRHFASLLEKFNSAFSKESPLDDVNVIKAIKKLQLEPNKSYLLPSDENFYAIARDTIFKYSEIDLKKIESEEIINNLVSLVEKKSFSKLLENCKESDLDEIAGICLEDMLDILSISKGAYNHLHKGGDSQAIKNASIIQRLLKQGGASDTMIEFASKCKVNWDIWYREKRHNIPEFDLNFIMENISLIAKEWSINNQSIFVIKEKVEGLNNELKKISNTLTVELLLGGVFSVIVRNESQ
ncbi:protein of unknown function [Lutibacter oricola]|uniref:CD-NTase associated protein 4-like DNA endonuclease domain-containing protein n=1 Tax=Lutibacter oricola TaxID=762486 RepID=A0A1H2WLG1_9FLAO|nr:dsDNA nuclease domain-containing protein [Lutibacter oricola]SDW81405.1 protein of unknown function [Lutibacter oricola]